MNKSNLLPNNFEISCGNFLKSLFEFETTISYHIYDYGTRKCSILIEETNEPYPIMHTNDNSLDWVRGKNSNIIAKFAREKLRFFNIRYYCSRKGFYIDVENIKKLKLIIRL